MRALGMDILLSCVPSLAEYFHVPFSTTQWLLSIYFFGAGIGQLIVGPLSDEFGRRKILIYSTWLIMFSSFACAQAHNIYLLLLLRFLQGLGACGTTVVSMAIMRDLYPNNLLAKIYSYFNGLIALAPLLGPLLGSVLLVQTGTWRTTFYFMVLFSAVALIVDYVYVKESNPRLTLGKTFVKVPIIKSYITLFKDKEFLSYCSFDIMGMSSLFMFLSMSAIILIKTLGLDPHTYGFYFAASSMMYLLGNILSPRLQNKLKINGTILIGSIIMLLGGASMLLLNHIYGISVLGVVLPNCLATFGVGLLFGPSMAGVVMHYKHIAGIASAAYGALFLCGSSLIVGIVMQIWQADALVLGAGLTVTGAINIFVVRRLQRKKVAL